MIIYLNKIKLMKIFDFERFWTLINVKISKKKMKKKAYDVHKR